MLDQLLNVTEHPTAEWVIQQLKDAFPFESAPKYLIFDRDSIFSARVKQFITNMVTRPKVTGYKCPWQNGMITLETIIIVVKVNSGYPKQKISIISMLSELLRGTGNKQSYVHPKYYAKTIILLRFDDNQGNIIC